ncbi:hypothetical protein GCM10010441_47400 [Kitasatospora paracochleata]
MRVLGLEFEPEEADPPPQAVVVRTIAAARARAAGIRRVGMVELLVIGAVGEVGGVGEVGTEGAYFTARFNV